jgi:peptidyl-prolyl cis-trans isomerase C
VAVFEDGTKVTMREYKQLSNNLGAGIPRDPATFFHLWATGRKLARMAEEEKISQESPWKEILDYQRMMILAQAKTTQALATMTVEPDAIVKYYDGNKERFKQVKVKAIYVAFSAEETPKDKKSLTEQQAKAKVDKLLAELRGGADFVKLVKGNSDDETSRAKDGDFATVHPNDNIPDAMRQAVFKLKQGEVSEPVRQPKGFYLFRAEEVGYRPLSEVRDTIFNELKNKQFGEWLNRVNSEAKVDFPNPAFVGQSPALQIPLTPAK